MSQIKDSINIFGRLKLILIDAFGNIKQEQEVDNLVVTAGKNFIASRIKDATAAVMSHMALGTSSTTPAATDTALGAEISGSRTVLSSTTVSGNTVTYNCAFAAGIGTGAVVEAGIFNAPTGGTMLCRTTFPVINKGPSDTLSITWTVSIL